MPGSGGAASGDPGSVKRPEPLRLACFDKHLGAPAPLRLAQTRRVPLPANTVGFGEAGGAHETHFADDVDRRSARVGFSAAVRRFQRTRVRKLYRRSAIELAPPERGPTVPAATSSVTIPAMVTSRLTEGMRFLRSWRSARSELITKLSSDRRPLMPVTSRSPVCLGAASKLRPGKNYLEAPNHTPSRGAPPLCPPIVCSRYCLRG